MIEKFEFDAQITRLSRANLLYLVVSKFGDPRVDLHPDKVSNLEMGYLYEELIRRFSELSNETAGEHFTPREVIRLMVDLLLADEPEPHKASASANSTSPTDGPAPPPTSSLSATPTVLLVPVSGLVAEDAERAVFELDIDVVRTPQGTGFPE
ncbi:MAG: N-6 DNA methylase [Pseudonocardiaceae bacterium]